MAVESFCLRLTFQCASNASNSLKDATMEVSLIATVLDVKCRLQSTYNIPKCVQIMYWEGVMLKDNQSLYRTGLRHGDCITVNYQAQGSCREVMESIDWLNNVVEDIRVNGPPTISSTGVFPHLNSSDIEKHLINLCFKRFYPWSDPQIYVNKLMYLHEGALDQLCSLLKLLVSVPWHELMLLQGKIVTARILIVLWNFGESFYLRRQLHHRQVVEICLNALSIKPIPRYTEFFDDSTDIDDDTDEATFELITCACGLLTNLSELEECRIEISTNSQALSQLVDLILCPTFHGQGISCAVLTFMCLANTEATHVHLCRANIITGLLDRISTISHLQIQHDESTLIEYHILMFIIQLILFSPQYLPPEVLPLISHHLKTFISTADPEYLCTAEINSEEIWYSFLPYVKLVYQLKPKSSDKLITDMHHLSLELSVISLHNMLNRSVHRAVLIQEKLLDFITCIPWYGSYEPNVEKRIIQLMEMIRKCPDMQLRPPSLVNACKAMLAKHYCGLSNVIVNSIPDILQFFI